MHTGMKENTAAQSFNPDITNKMVSKYFADKGYRCRCDCGESSWILDLLHNLPERLAELPITVTCSVCGKTARINYLEIKKYFVVH